MKLKLCLFLAWPPLEPAAGAACSAPELCYCRLRRLWSELYCSDWSKESWAFAWPYIEELGSASASWGTRSPLRSEYQRRAALVEIDSLVAVWLGIGIEELLAVLRSRYPILVDREAQTWFDAKGRKIASDLYTFGYGQTKLHYEQLMAYLAASRAKSGAGGVHSAVL